MEKKAKPGNPKILEAGMSTRMPAISPGEKSEIAAYRFPTSLLRRLEAIAEATGGSKSEHARKALEEYLEKLGY